ncbi:MAG: aminoacyl-tRNA hydrolase [Alphaproteobacteria bacterium]
MFLLVGLGNPGNEYTNTRHNVGFMALDNIVQRYNFSDYNKKYDGLVATGTIKGEKVIALKPQTYMNKSGISVSQAVNFFKIPLENVIVFYDELDLPTGKVRVKAGGGNGGHNGLKSIDAHAGKEYVKVRIGIDHPGDKNKVSGYVLSKFTTDEQIIIDSVNDEISRYSELLIENNEGEFMNKITLNTNID